MMVRIIALQILPQQHVLEQFHLILGMLQILAIMSWRLQFLQMVLFLLQSTEIIMSGASVDYDAANYVLMKNGFTVNAGAVFEAFIDGCNSGAGGVN